MNNEESNMYVLKLKIVIETLGEIERSLEYEDEVIKQLIEKRKLLRRY